MRREAVELAVAEAAAAKETEPAHEIPAVKTAVEAPEAPGSASVATVAKPKPKAPSRAS